MQINLDALPEWVKIEVRKGDLEQFAHQLIEQYKTANISTCETQGEVLSIEEAALFTRLAKQTLYSLSSQRKIPFYKRGKRVLFKRSELEQWLLENRRKPVSEIQQEILINPVAFHVTKKGGKK